MMPGRGAPLRGYAEAMAEPTSESLPTLLREWESFYLLIGTAGATLSGLLFVAVSLAPRLVTPQTVALQRHFTDPPLLAFALSLGLACLMLIPTLSAPLLAALLLLCGLLALGGALRTAAQLRRSGRAETFRPSDLLWRVAASILSSLLLLGAGGAAWSGALPLTLGLLAVSSLLLLFSGLRNAWDLMLWLVLHAKE